MNILTQKIAILGATGHIAKGLICNFSESSYKNIFLFARSLTRVQYFLDEINCRSKWKKKSFDEFKKYDYDVIINCVGLGTPSKVKAAGCNIFNLTESFDNMILEYLSNNPETLYINFSSGAVYGTDFTMPAKDSTFSKWNINNIKESDYYGIAKLNLEAKHRALIKFNIVDLRVFGYFSRFIDLESKYLITEMILCLKTGKVFITEQSNIKRDYIHPDDLFSLVSKCIDIQRLNNVYDVYSRKPVLKFEILDCFKKNFGLRYLVKKNVSFSSATGNKNNYYSNSKKAENLGYKPNFTSLDCILKETKEILRVK